MTVLLLNAALSFAIAALAPAQPRLSDRAEYEYTGRQPLAANCPNTIYCYRILVPALLETLPFDAELRWRTHAWLAHTLTGTVVSIAVAPFASPWMSAVLLQSSYGFSFTAYDPYTPDPLVFLIAALILYLWLHDRPVAVALLVMVGVFVKETVALLACAPAAAVLLSPERWSRWRWLLPAALAWVVLLSFHWYMDTFAGWGIAKNPAASFATGSWLALWWKNNPSLTHKALIVFSPFAFGWVFAVLGTRTAPPALRQLALGAIAPIAVLTYVQTPERALSNAFFVVVPLAAVFLSRVQPAAAWAAAITTAFVTARMGLSTEWLPPSAILLVPATLAAGWAVASSRGKTA